MSEKEPVKKKRATTKKATPKEELTEDIIVEPKEELIQNEETDSNEEDKPKIKQALQDGEFKIYDYRYKTIKLYFLDNKSISGKLIKCEAFELVVEIIKDEKPVLLYVQKSSLKFISFPPESAKPEPIDYKYLAFKKLLGQEITIFFKNESKSVTGILKGYYTYEIILTVKINNAPVDIMIYKASVKYSSIEINKDIFK